MNSLNVGIIGCGNISSIYLQNIPAYRGLSLRACADLRPEAAQAQASRFGVEAMPVDELLAREDIDLVVNLTIPGAHFGVSLAALTRRQARLLGKAARGRLRAGPQARRGGRGARPAPRLRARHLPRRGGRLARKLVDDGAVGRILSGTAFLMSHGMEHWHPDPEFFFKPGGGPILDMAPYYLSALVNLLGPVKRVFADVEHGFPERIVTAKSPAQGRADRGRDADPRARRCWNSPPGAQVTFCMSWDVWKHGHPPIELYGTEGSLRVPDPNFFGGSVEITERGGDWRAVDAERHAARRAELALAQLGARGALARQLPGARPRRSRERRPSRHAASLHRPARASRARGDARSSKAPPRGSPCRSRPRLSVLLFWMNWMRHTSGGVGPRWRQSQKASLGSGRNTQLLRWRSRCQQPHCRAAGHTHWFVSQPPVGVGTEGGFRT